MPNYLDELRRRNILSPFSPTDLPQGGGPSSPPSLPVSTFSGGNDDDIFKPEHSASDKFNAMLSDMPTRQRPGLLRTIASGVIGGLGGGDIDQLMNAPYYHSMQDFNAKLGPTERAANLERQSNVAGQNLFNQNREAGRRETNDERRFQSEQGRLTQAERDRQTREKIANDKADLARLKMNQPDLKFNYSGPTVLVTDPRTGKITDSKVPTGSLSDLDKLAYQHGDKLEEIAAGGEEARKTAVVHGEQARATKTVSSGSAGATSQLPSQVRVKRFNAAKQLKDTNTDLGKFIKMGIPGTNDFEIADTGRIGLAKQGWGIDTGPTPEQRKAINKFVYGDEAGEQTKIAAPPEFGKEPGVKQVNGKYTWTTDHGSFEWDGRGWVKSGK